MQRTRLNFNIGNHDGLSDELEREIQRLDELFWISREKLKAISERFEEELVEGMITYLLCLILFLTKLGLQENGRNIVSTSSADKGYFFDKSKL